MRDMLRKWTSILCVFVMVTLNCFLGGLQVKAAGESNIVSFADLHFDGFIKTAGYVSDMGNIAEITLDMPGITLKNIRFDLSTRQMSYDIALDHAAVMTSGSRTDWNSDNQRTRYLDITVYASNSSSSSSAEYYTHTRVENLNWGFTPTSNTFITNAGDFVVQHGGALAGEIPTKISIGVYAGDNNHRPNEPSNGWRNSLSEYLPEKNLTSNAAPSITIPSPNGQQLGPSSLFVPVIGVTDSNGDALELKYFVDSEAAARESKTVTNTATMQTVSFSPLNVASMSEGSHTIRFTASDGKVTTQNSITIFVDKSPPAIGNVNIISSDSQVQVSGTAADSISGLDNVPYRYTVGSQSSGWTTNPSFTATGLASNTAFYTKIEARDKVGNIAVHEQNVYTRAQVPSLSLQQNGETSLMMQLHDQNAASTQYLIQMGTSYVTSSGSLTSSPVWITPASKTVIINGLTANTSYTFQAKSRNNEGVETAFGAAASGTTLAAAPSGITAEASQQWIKLEWPSSANALGYEVEASGAIIHNGTSTTYTQNGLLPNTQHTYRVRVINAGGTSQWSQPFIKLTLPEPPVAPVNLLTVPSQKFISLTWDLVPHATRYEVEADGVVTDNGKLNSFMHKDLEASTDHTYRVRAGNTGGVSEWSQPASQQTWPNPPESPTKIAAVQDIHTVIVKWDEMERASGYEIEVDGLIIDNKKLTSYTHEGLAALSGHTYRIRAVNIGGKSAWSSPLDVTTHPEIPDVPTNIMTTADERQITASWRTVPHTDSYDIEMDNGAVTNVTENIFVHDQLPADSRHTYRIRANNISGHSEWSKPIIMTTMPAGMNTESLTNVVAVVTNKSITLSWDTVATDARYEIEVDGKLLDNAADTIYNHVGLRAEEYHLYKIRVKQANERGDWVAVLALSTLPNLPDSPSKIEGFAQNSSIELRWEKIDGANGYQLEVDGKTIDVGNNINYLHNELLSGTAHTYRVRAKNTTGVTAWSPALQKSTTSPDYVLKVKKDGTASLTLLAQNVQDFSELEFVVTYNPDELELIDLYDFTPVSDLSNGRVPGSNLTATYTAGKVTLSMDQNVVPGTSWSGEITTLMFKSRITGESNVKVTVD
ncbi:fibronectin type III domain-containing protein [Paenibacillus tritici]|uniref:Fibronectin type III domain-containing protein n=1 Tax=Paenibacillus tritici TaxID=1873425 RepID=A0ABX2DUZ0_9BACL|nr:fibronectin type III domain-containing protein [Paenibacillus tritici]NQX48220.1 fibronectin type III domain-containing protein [Paenibacillus tritici]